MIIYVDGGRVKRNKPAIRLVYNDRQPDEFVREVELRCTDGLAERRVAKIIQRGPDEQGPHGARVWIEVDEDEVLT